MTLEEAQKTVDEWIKTYGVRYFSELTNMAVLTVFEHFLERIVVRSEFSQLLVEILLDFYSNLVCTLRNDSYALVDVSSLVTEVHDVTCHCVYWRF